MQTSNRLLLVFLCKALISATSLKVFLSTRQKELITEKKTAAELQDDAEKTEEAAPTAKAKGKAAKKKAKAKAKTHIVAADVDVYAPAVLPDDPVERMAVLKQAEESEAKVQELIRKRLRM